MVATVVQAIQEQSEPLVFLTGRLLYRGAPPRTGLLDFAPNSLLSLGRRKGNPWIFLPCFFGFPSLGLDFPSMHLEEASWAEPKPAGSAQPGLTPRRASR
jgi:hypothetical protein